MSQFCTLDIVVHRRRSGNYGVRYRFSEPGSAADVSLGESHTTDIHLDIARLQFLVFDIKEYSRDLTDCFFAEESVRTMFANAQAASARLQMPLRVILDIAEDCSELHGVRWELLQDPVSGVPLFMGENLYFSRYLGSTDWRKVKLRKKAKLHALVLVANPVDISSYQGLAPIEVDGEVDRIRQGMPEITLSVLGVGNERASLNNLSVHLRTEKPDILFIVCHGAILRGEPYLWLEDSSGMTAVTPGNDLVEQFVGLAQPPLLVVLASCQSAGHESAPDVRSALGPRLAEAGVPAVVAMQGNFSQETAAEFMPVFFKALQEDGQVDRAMSLGRGRVRQQPDYWMPVLFSRLREGAIFIGPEQKVNEAYFGWRSWTILASVVLVGFLGVISYMAWPQARNMRLKERCILCIAVAGFQEEINHSSFGKLGTDIGAELSGQLDLNLNELRNETNRVIAVWGPDEVKTLSASNTAELDHAAEDLAKNIGADILVYGTIKATEDAWEVFPRFIVSPNYFFKDLSEIIGQHELGSSAKFDEPDEMSRKLRLMDLNDMRSRLLTTIVMGETYMVFNDYEKALELFLKLEDDTSSWEDPAAVKLVNLLLGNAYGRTYVVGQNPDVLNKAEEKYKAALTSDPNYSRAYLGLGSVAYARAIEDVALSEIDIGLEAFQMVNLAELDKCESYTSKAIGLLQSPDLPHIKEKAAYALGKAYMAEILYNAMTTGQNVDLQPAIDEFLLVTNAYNDNSDEVMIELAAEAYANLGQIYTLTDEKEVAKAQYGWAIKLTNDPERKRAFKAALGAID